MMVQKVLISLLKRAFEIEENDSNVVMRMYLYEENGERKKILYSILKDTEYHKIMLADLLKELGADTPTKLSELRDYDFEEMYFDQKLNILRRIEETARDFYRSILDDIIGSEKELGGAVYKKAVSIFEELVAWEEKHVELVEKLKETGLN